MPISAPLLPPPRRLLPLLALALALGCAGCQEPPKEKLSGRFGPGSGGPAFVGPAATVPITKASGTVVGYLEYDSDPAAGFTPLGAAAAERLETLIDASGTLGIELVRISGRPDTPCRFQAALLARDEEFEILKSGDRKNDQNLEFHEVDLEKGGVWLSLFCTTLRDEVGVLVQVLTDSPEKIHWVQVHYLLNSIRKG